MRKGITSIVAVIFVLVALIAGAGAMFTYQKYSVKEPIDTTQKSEIPYTSPSPVAETKADETANWKTYLDTKLGYELKYPNDWKVTSNPGMDFLDQKKENLNVIYAQYLTARDKATIGMREPCLPEGKCQLENVKLGANSFYVEIRENRFIYVDIPRKNGDSVIFYSQIETLDSKTIFNQILSTFKFLD